MGQTLFSSVYDKFLEKGSGSPVGRLVREKGSLYIDGESAFRLYDTYGFPIDLTREIADEQKMKIDEGEERWQSEIFESSVMRY